MLLGRVKISGGVGDFVRLLCVVRLAAPQTSLKQQRVAGARRIAQQRHFARHQVIWVTEEDSGGERYPRCVPRTVY